MKLEKVIIVIPPCLLTPFYVYRGATEKEYKASESIINLLSSYSKHIIVFTYPCPEYALLGWPRPPMSKEVYEKLGIQEKIREIAKFIKRVLNEEKAKKIIFIGVKGSPTCGIFYTTSSDPKIYPYEFIEKFASLNKYDRLKYKEEIKEKAKLRLVAGAGSLYEVIRKEFPNAIYFEFDKNNIENSIK
jgi:predicted secreted protein